MFAFRPKRKDRLKKMTELSSALRRRLPAYFRTLIRIYGQGKERISSEELAAELGLVPSQVRTDMKAIGCTGQRSYGYGIPTLYKAIAEILQLSDKFSAVIIGSTNLARAIAENHVFSKRGVKLTAVFTEDGRADGFTLLPECEKKKIAEVRDYFDASCPNIIILSCSTDCAAAVLELAESCFEPDENCAIIPEIWNFTDLELRSDRIKVKNIHMSDYLMILCLDAGR